MQQLLTIEWNGEKEFIPFDEDDLELRQIRTTSRWPDGREVIYIANASLIGAKTSRTLKLTYHPEDQTDANIRSQPPGQVRYGELLIDWRKGDLKGQARVWTHKKDSRIG